MRSISEEYEFSVVIATYKRPKLCLRAVESVIRAAGDKYRVEVVVVDDASPGEVPQLPDPNSRLLVQPGNAGPGPARMRGIREARAPHVVILDDDDELLPDAFKVISARLAELERAGLPDWLVTQFRSSNATLPVEFLVAGIEDYLQNRLSGDFSPVFHKRRFLASGLEYPNIRIGGERLLWWKIAQAYGIPTWSDSIVSVSDDAAVRLTHTATQIVRADEHLELAEMAWSGFADTLVKLSPAEAQRVCMGGLTYSVLAGQRRRGWRFFRSLNTVKARLVGGCVLLLPKPMARRLFVAFRARRS